MATLMQPVVRCLETLGVQQAVLVPAGLLALLPLHAAWTEQAGRRLYALDRVTWTYAPSARAFTHARRIAARTPDGHLLAVDEPRPVSGNRLPNSQAEVAAITALFKSSQTLRHAQATRRAVLDAVPQAQVAHFSCHGATDWADPLHSGLVMAQDERLTVQDLFGLRLAGARLATLSACETGIIGTELPDEGVVADAHVKLAVAAEVDVAAVVVAAAGRRDIHQLDRRDGRIGLEARGVGRVAHDAVHRWRAGLGIVDVEVAGNGPARVQSDPQQAALEPVVHGNSHESLSSPEFAFYGSRRKTPTG